MPALSSLYGSEAQTTHAKQEKKLHSYHLHCLCHILLISWRDKVPNSKVLSHAGIPTIYTGCAGLDMSTGWKMAKPPKPSSTVSLNLARGLLATHSYATMMSASVTWEHSSSTTGKGGTLQMTILGGDAFSSIRSGRERKGSSAKLRKDKGEDIEEGRALLGSWRHTDADTARGLSIQWAFQSHPTLSSCRTDFN